MTHFGKRGAAAVVLLCAIGVAAAAFGIGELVSEQRSQIAELAGRLQEVKETSANLRSLADQLAESRKAEDDRAAASRCTVIDVIPFVIRQSGQYCLSVSARYYASEPIRFAIAVMAADVEIDLMGAKLDGPNRPDHVSEGIYSAGHRNLTVRNGTISGFMYGVRIDPPPEPSDSGTYAFRQLDIIDSSFRGISVDLGARSKATGIVNISDVSIARTGGTTIFPNAFTMGIELANTRHCSIEKTTIFDVSPSGVGEGIGIALSDNNQLCVIEDNFIINTERPKWGRTIALWSNASEANFLFSRNFVSNFTYAAFNYDKAALFRNTLHSIDCTPRNTDDYYSTLNRTGNVWLNEEESCSDKPSEFEAAATAGDPRAQYRMARMIIEGITIDTTDTEAVRWLSLAAAQGLTIAAEQLEGMRKAGRIEQGHSETR